MDAFKIAGIIFGVLLLATSLQTTAEGRWILRKASRFLRRQNKIGRSL
jgi:hypothetical protein